jgi:serine/threonine protein kinase
MVYRAIQESLGRTVALKILNSLYSDSDEFTARFLAEGRLLAALSHPNIITIYDLGAAEHFHYIAMEFLERPDLKVAMRYAVPLEDAVTYLRKLASALGYAHANGIVHRDVKPSNVLFRNDGTPLLSDFGIAKQIDVDGELTITGSTVGSPHYLSPEQARGQKVDPRADIYSLGIMLYELLTGMRPFSGDSNFDTMMLHVTDELPLLPERFGAFQALLSGMTAKRVEDRMDDTREVIEGLDAAYARSISGPPDESPALETNRPTKRESPQAAPKGTAAALASQRASTIAEAVRSLDASNIPSNERAEAAFRAFGLEAETLIVRRVQSLVPTLRAIAGRPGTGSQLALSLVTLQSLSGATATNRVEAGKATGVLSASQVQLRSDSETLVAEQLKLRAGSDYLEQLIETGETVVKTLSPSGLTRAGAPDTARLHKTWCCRWGNG